MRLTSLARRYAGALFTQAKDTDAIDRIESDLGLITYSLQTMPRLSEVLSHPLIPAAQKKKIVAEVFKNEIEPLTLHFVELLIDKRREELLEDTEQEFVKLANESRGVVPATATSAVPLTPEEKTQLRASLEASTGKKIELHTDEDPSLIGGVVVKIGDTIIDGSVSGYLAALKNRLLGRE